MTSASTPAQTTEPVPPAHLRAPVPVQTRSERFTSTEVADFPEVTGREVMWKHTPVARLTELLTGELDGAPYVYDATTAPGVTTAWIGRDDAHIGAAGTPEDRASANAWTGFERALLVSIAGDDAKEVTLTRSALGGAARAAHTVVEVAGGARATLILQNSGPAHLSENVEFLVGKDADLTVVTVQEWDDDALHVAAHFAELAEGARIKHVAVTLGGGVVRLNPSAHLAGARSDAELLGAYFADADQHLEQQVYVYHDGPETRSRVTYKGALQGVGARTVWIGDVLIGPKATGTDTYEQNRNLVLTDGARADSIPNLEIETGDIVGAGHASATGRFDDEQLFYLQSRGIPEEEARRLVVRGFLFEIVQQIGSPALQERLQTAIEAELALSVTAAS
ncbi:ABC transporter permease [Leifsonia xyli subsp. xyli]|uniref:ABC transporter, membrane component n=2 Tax=Leifsonia xyli subsp. xyli TaxID=59736 RepID=Q6AF31_LEIXX|nr:Fe-S cluster assembly protein SufD [Leifsonia xyli]AAT89014.1 ABC transporter, membrane component [Leifsonia xyli subsp. xyli str. CTCB07]ODA90494.1 ABC transporter permease [Leifsonia xyli subsp. xyli]